MTKILQILVVHKNYTTTNLKIIWQVVKHIKYLMLTLTTSLKI